MAVNKGLFSTDRSFEEVYKTSYSHGLESIYRLETVDLKTVRKLEFVEESSPQSEKKPSKQDKQDPNFDFGPLFSGYLSSFILKEPIQILKLSRHIEKNLLDEGYKTLFDLSKADFTTLSFVKGMGQGHILELKERLQSALEREDVIKPSTINWASWLRSLVGTLETKMAWALLEGYGLETVFSLTPLESVEIKKLTLERKSDLKDQAKLKVSDSEKVKEVRERLFEIESVMLKPWILSRGGVASEDEILERLALVSTDPKNQKGMMLFLKDFFVDGPFFQLPGERGLIFSSAESWGEFCLLETHVLDSLWSDEAEVPFEYLFVGISKKFMLSWKAIDKEFLYKVISLSPRIRRVKHSTGNLHVKRRPDYLH